MNEKLQEIGSKLDVTHKDIKIVKNVATKEKLEKIFLHPISTLIISILTFIAGFKLGEIYSEVSGPYPYMRSGFGLAGISTMGKKSLIFRIVIPILAFVAGFYIAKETQNFGVAVLYNAFYKKQNK